MKTIITINGEEVEITLTDEQVRQIKKEKGCKKWKPKGGQYWVSRKGEIHHDIKMNNGTFASEYATKEQAETARDQMRVFNLLLAKKIEECPNQEGYIIVRKQKEWVVQSHWHDHYYPGFVSFSKKVAKKICEELNDPELNFLH